MVPAVARRRRSRRATRCAPAESDEFLMVASLMYAIDVGKSYGAMRILYVEPFEAGSHAQFGEVLRMALPAEWTRIVLPGRHWKWRMRSSAVYATLAAADYLHADYDVLLAS